MPPLLPLLHVPFSIFPVSTWFNIVSVLLFNNLSLPLLCSFFAWVLCVFLPRQTVSHPSSSSFASRTTQSPEFFEKPPKRGAAFWCPVSLVSVCWTAETTLALVVVPRTLSAQDCEGTELPEWLRDVFSFETDCELNSKLRTGLVAFFSSDVCNGFALENSALPGDDFLTSHARDVGLWKTKMLICTLLFLADYTKGNKRNKGKNSYYARETFTKLYLSL